MAVLGRNRTLFQNAIIEKNMIKNIDIYHSLAAVVHLMGQQTGSLA